MQCDGCYYQDRKENVCLHGSPIFDIDDNCTDYVEDDFVKKIRAYERTKLKNKIESFRLSAYLTLANSGDDKREFAYEQVVWVLDHLNKELDLRASDK